MLDIKYILSNMDEYAGMLRNRKHDFDFGILTELDAKAKDYDELKKVTKS